MASYENGPNGSFSGKVGTVVGVNRDGRPYMRSLPGRRKKSKNPKEIANREKFAKAQLFLRPLLSVVKEGFGTDENKGYEFVTAKSWLLKNAFEGEWDNQTINPAKVQLSIGDLHLPTNIAVGMPIPGQLDFTWDPVSKTASDARDQVMIIAYNLENKFFIGELAGEFRYKGIDSIQLPDFKLDYHLYLAFVSADRKKRSNSVYLGLWKG